MNSTVSSLGPIHPVLFLCIYNLQTNKKTGHTAHAYFYLMVYHEEGLGSWTCMDILCVNFCLPRERSKLSRERRVTSASLRQLPHPFLNQCCRADTEEGACQGPGDFKAVCTGLCVCVHTCAQRMNTHEGLLLNIPFRNRLACDEFLGLSPECLTFLPQVCA